MRRIWFAETVVKSAFLIAFVKRFFTVFGLGDRMVWLCGCAVVLEVFGVDVLC